MKPWDFQSREASQPSAGKPERKRNLTHISAIGGIVTFTHSRENRNQRVKAVYYQNHTIPVRFDENFALRVLVLPIPNSSSR